MATGEELEPLKVGAVPTIRDRRTYGAAVAIRQKAKDYLDRVESFFEGMKKKAWDTYKEIQAREKEARGQAEQVLRQANEEIGRWEELQSQELKRLQNAAQAEAEAEALEKRKQAAQALLDAGYSPEAAEAVIDERLEVTAAVVKPSHVTDDKLSVRRTWHHEVVDKAALLKFVTSREGKRFEHLVEPDDVALGKMARDLKEKASIPGVKFFYRTSVADKARR